MLIIVLLFIIIAISLNYFNQNALEVTGSFFTNLKGRVETSFNSNTSLYLVERSNHIRGFSILSTIASSKQPIFNPPPYVESQVLVLLTLFVWVVVLLWYKPKFIIPFYLFCLVILHFLVDIAILAWISLMLWGYPSMYYYYLLTEFSHYYWAMIPVLFKITLLILHQSNPYIITELWHIHGENIFVIFITLVNNAIAICALLFFSIIILIFIYNK